MKKNENAGTATLTFCGERYNKLSSVALIHMGDITHSSGGLNTIIPKNSKLIGNHVRDVAADIYRSTRLTMKHSQTLTLPIKIIQEKAPKKITLAEFRKATDAYAVNKENLKSLQIEMLACEEKITDNILKIKSFLRDNPELVPQ